ncbi:sensor histidine kinase [Conexibacter arvalis]|uniref:Oxygen sensor histidine kinase NreB n=1 Tax=Conexibacter arvalis TaxID=912552 RepID=A0A840IGP9_9ACTN|nr:ATP-binding protein [Conexibacter arvalis]MBB4663959.1 signal transduction histidine kinase [Conexibacter arvalis]
MARRLLGGRARHAQGSRPDDRRPTRRRRPPPTRAARRRRRDPVAAALAEQRREIARDVHDGVAQELAFIVFQLDRLPSRADDERALLELRAAARRALREARLTIDELRAARELPLSQLLEEEVSSFESRSGVAVDLRLELSCDVDRDRRIAVLRILGQALANAADHGAARRVRVHVHARDDRVALSVADDGAGFASAAAAGSHGWGILSMRERAELLGGSFSVVSAPGRGTEVAVSLP